MKDVIIAKKDVKKDVKKNVEVEVLNFYLVSRAGSNYLFTQKFSKGVYEYFKNGKSEREVKAFNKWEKNPRLNKTIEKIPTYTKYVYQHVM